MKEIRFLKDLPCKLLNKNKDFIKLVGGDIYYDKDSNRYAFLTFENLNNSPIFFIQLAIREYSIEGKLIKDQDFYIPYLYAPKGEFVNEMPIEIEKETEAVEVLIAKATFDRQNFVNDRLENFRTDDYIANKPQLVPLKDIETLSSSSFKFPQAEEVKSAEAPKVEAPQSEEKPVEEEALAQPAQKEEPVYEEPVETETARGTYKVRKHSMCFIVLGITVVFIALALFISFLFTTSVVNRFIESHQRYYEEYSRYYSRVILETLRLWIK